MNDKKLVEVFELMVRSRLFEEAVKRIWEEGKIPGEMHLGIGEEAIFAGVISNLKDGDAVATDHRSTPAFIMSNIDSLMVLLECMGHKKGLCCGLGGHMHLFSKEHLMSSSGIVGASGPAAVGYALSLKYKKTDNIAVAFFGEGAMNQGMLLESINLASVWNLPVLFVCKDSEWAITTKSNNVTGGNLIERAQSFGIKGVKTDGTDVEKVYEIAKRVISSMRGKKKRPFFIQATCFHREGHFLGDALLRYHKGMIREFSKTAMPLTKSVIALKGARFDKRLGSLGSTLGMIASSRKQMKENLDPLRKFKRKYSILNEELTNIEAKVRKEMDSMTQKAMRIIGEEVD
ncbi:MAG: thiamine pyrophosphate-dependent dehydrogenase E1 component subunit alpha [Candidatus Hodarchaeales archaeon]